ncbi:MAG: peptidylprolyl isomerase [Pseudomonadota bacterium]
MTPYRPERPAGAYLAAFLCLVMVIAPRAGIGQSVFDPAIRVNDTLITRYDLAQRVELLAALGAAGDLSENARDRLIEERLQLQAAAEAEIEATEEAIEAGIDELAGRANVSREEFLAGLARRGVAEETLYDFVEAGILWRRVIRARIGNRASVSEEEVDRAVTLLGREGGVRVLLSEIILPARDAAETSASEERAAEIAQISSFDAFSDAARNFSVSQTRGVGGRLDWLPLTRLPPALRSELLTLPTGRISSPVRLPNAIALFQLRALEELPVSNPATVAIDYAEFRIPNGSQADARRIAGEIDTCDDLYGTAFGLPADRLVRAERPVGEIPGDVRAALESLDENEVSTSVRRGNVQLLLMLCGRTTAVSEEIDRAALRRALLNQRIESFSASFLSELRADALIIDLQ